jgi:hypothetical protein
MELRVLTASHSVAFDVKTRKRRYSANGSSAAPMHGKYLTWDCELFILSRVSDVVIDPADSKEGLRQIRGLPCIGAAKSWCRKVMAQTASAFGLSSRPGLEGYAKCVQQKTAKPQIAASPVT